MNKGFNKSVRRFFVCITLIWALLFLWGCTSQPDSTRNTATTETTSNTTVKGWITLQLEDEAGSPCPNAFITYAELPYDIPAELGKTDETGCIVWENAFSGPQELIVRYEDGSTAVFEGEIKESDFHKTLILKPAKEFKIYGRTTPSYTFAAII